MTFTQQVKNEILKSVRNVKGCCAEAFLQGVFRSTGWLSLGFNGLNLAVDSENVDFLKYLCDLSQRACGVKGRIEDGDVSASGVAVYSAFFGKALADKLNITFADDEGLTHISGKAQGIFDKDCCKRTFMQALFVCCGSVSVPVSDDAFGARRGSERYHLELRFTNEELADAVFCNVTEWDFKKITRRGYKVLYVKKSDVIADLLVYLDATNAKLLLENVIIERSIRNEVNRQTNCIQANIDKSVLASQRQLEAIRTLRAKGKFNTLPQQLVDAALARERMPDANIMEIASVLGISKSGANHRLKKLVELAED